MSLLVFHLCICAFLCRCHSFNPSLYCLSPYLELLVFYYCIYAFLCSCSSFNLSLCCLSKYLPSYVAVSSPCHLSEFYPNKASVNSLLVCLQPVAILNHHTLFIYSLSCYSFAKVLSYCTCSYKSPLTPD